MNFNSIEQYKNMLFVHQHNTNLWKKLYMAQHKIQFSHHLCIFTCIYTESANTYLIGLLEEQFEIGNRQISTFWTTEWTYIRNIFGYKT